MSALIEYDDLYVEDSANKSDNFQGCYLKKTDVIYPKVDVISKEDCALCIKHPTLPMHYIYAPLNQLDKKLFHDTIQAIRALNLPVLENVRSDDVLSDGGQFDDDQFDECKSEEGQSEEGQSEDSKSDDGQSDCTEVWSEYGTPTYILNKHVENTVSLPYVLIETNIVVMSRYSPTAEVWHFKFKDIGTLRILCCGENEQEKWEKCSVCGYIIPYDLQHYRKKPHTAYRKYIPSDYAREKAEQVLWCEQCYRATVQAGVTLDVEPRIESTGMGNIRDYVYMFSVSAASIHGGHCRYYCNLNPLSEHYGRYAAQHAGDFDFDVFEFDTSKDVGQRGVDAALSILRMYV
jgi:hypothetical protein